MNLTDIRKEIDAVDAELVKLFVRRMQAADAVADAKRGTGRPVFDPAREREILARVSRSVGPAMEDEARLLFSTLMSLSRGRQRADLADHGAFAKGLQAAIASTPERIATGACVACPGTEGGYSQQAASAMVRVPTLFYFRDFDSVFSAVEKGMCAYGVLPIENSTAGSVTQVYDMMNRHDFKIAKALKLRIRHVLLAAPGVKLEDVKEISSHPHALAQCSRFLFAHPTIRTAPALNTALAAEELAKSGRRDQAVIASRECAELYGLEVIGSEIADTLSNFTRFILISRTCEVYPDANKLSIMMSLSHRPGALADVLVRFAAAGVNLTKLESRPVPGSDFEFSFIFDFEASPRDPAVVRLLSGFASDPGIESFAFLGAYAER